jgi:hypothetical protein
LSGSAVAGVVIACGTRAGQNLWCALVVIQDVSGFLATTR